MSRTDPVAMLDELPTLTDSMTKERGWEETAEALMPVLAARGQEASEHWIDSLPEIIRAEFLTAYSDQWRWHAPEGTLDYLMSKPMNDHLVDTAQSIVGTNLARKDPAAVGDLVTGFQDQQMREVGTQNVMSNWLATAPAEAERWAETHHGCTDAR